jgi:hypothetical protein
MSAGIESVTDATLHADLLSGSALPPRMEAFVEAAS